MGLFSSKYVTQVGTSVTRVMEDDALPNAIKTGSLKAFFREGELTEYVMEELASSIGVRAERMYDYAENHYVHGLPSGEIYSATQGRAQVEAIIEAAEGQQVLMKYSNFGPPNTLHIGWMKLISQYGYNTVTNELATLSAQKGKTVYLEDMVVVVPESQFDTLESSALELWGTSPTAGYTPKRTLNINGLGERSVFSPIVKSATAIEVQLKVTYVWETTPNNFSTESLTISIAEYDPAVDYFHAKYEVNGQPKYWIYENDTGTYPTLDAVFTEQPAVSGSYFPFAYFRYNKQSVIQDKTTDAYKTSKKMVEYIGMDYDMMAETINENPDIADVEQAMLVMAVPAVSTDKIECQYLFDYFDTLHYDMDGGTSAAVSNVGSRVFRRASESRSIVIKDKQFKMALQNTGIYKRLVAGTIGSVGTCTSAYVTTSEEREVVDQETGLVSLVSVPNKRHVYKKQIAPGLCEEITVTDLRMVYWIFGEYTTTGDENDDILLIPIDRTISRRYPMGEREHLYARSLHFVFNSRVVTKVKWYQTGVFKAILIIAAAIMSLYDGGWTLATILTTAGIQALIVTIIVTMVVGEIFATVFKLFVKVFGADVAMVLAIVAVLYGGYQMIQHGSIAGAPFASELLMLSSGLSQAALSAKMNDLMGEAEAFRLLAEEKTELLDKAEDLLDNTSFLSPFVIFGEKPEDFYNRTVHSGNIGIVGINAISYYVDIALTLPKLNDTLGEETYAT